MDESKVGIDRCKISNHDNVIVSNDSNSIISLLIAARNSRLDNFDSTHFGNQLRCTDLRFDNTKKESSYLEASWCEDEFAILTDKKYIDELYFAFQNNDIAITSIQDNSKMFEGDITLCSNRIQIT